MGILSLPVKRPGSHRYGLPRFGAHAEKEQAVVRGLAVSVSLDDVADLLNLPRLDLIKAYIKGWELRMLEGAVRSIERFRRSMMRELVDRFLNRAGDSLDAALRFLDTAEYRPAAWRQKRSVDADPATAG